MPLWGFFAGFIWGAQAVSLLFGTGVLSTMTGWLVGVVVGIGLAIFAYVFYQAAVALFVAFIGSWLLYSLMWQLGLSDGLIVSLTALVGGIALGILALYLKAPKGLLMLVTGFGGATATIGGLMVMFNLVPVQALGTDIVRSIIGNSLAWSLAWAALIIGGIFSQMAMDFWYLQQPGTTDGDIFLADMPDMAMGVKGGEVDGAVPEAMDDGENDPTIKS
jgi:hypothetical protein